MKILLSRCRRCSVMIAFLAATVVLPGLAGAATPAPEKTKALMQERVKTLEELVALVTRQHSSGKVSIEAYLTARNELLDAKIELAEDRKTRLALRRELVENLKRAETMVQMRLNQGTAVVEDALRAKVARLDAEIELARELENREGE